MIRQTLSTVTDAFWLACLWAGLFMGIEGALNIGLFMAWLIFLCSFVLLKKEHADDVMAEKPEWEIWRSSIFDFVAIVMLVWAGWWITGAAVLWAMLLNISSWVSFNNRSREAA